MDKTAPEIVSLLSALKVKIEICQEDLNANELGNVIYSSYLLFYFYF
jgi:hypothetical protein